MPYYSIVVEKATPVPSRSSVTTVALARAWLLAGGVHGGHSTAQEAKRGSNPQERALVHYRRSAFPSRGHVWARVCHRSVLRPRAGGHEQSAAARNSCVEEASGPLGRASVDRYLGGLLAMTGAMSTRTRSLRKQRQRSMTSDRRERRGIAMLSWPTSSSWQGISRQRGTRSRHSAPIARRARMSDYFGSAAAWLSEVAFERGRLWRFRALARSCSKARCTQVTF